MLEWIRFCLTALLLLVGLFLLVVGVVAQYRFHYVLNRMHAASMGDSLGLMLVLISLCVSSGDGWLILKYVLVVLFLWLTSPTASHLIARLELVTNEHLEREMTFVTLSEGTASPSGEPSGNQPDQGGQRAGEEKRV